MSDPRSLTPNQQSNTSAGTGKSITAFLEGLNDMANLTTDIDEGLQAFLKSVCEYSGWPVGHAYIWDKFSEQLLSSRNWYLKPGSSFEAFVEVSEQASFKVGLGLPGRVVESGKPLFIKNVMEDSNFPRNKQAKNLGVRGAFAVPIKIGKDTIAVAEFFAEEEAEASEMLMGLMLTAASQMARVFERNQRTKAIDSLVERFETDVLSIINEVNSATGSLAKMATEMRASSDNAGSSVTAISTTAKQTSADVSSVAEATTDLNAAIQELDNSTRKTADNVEQASSRSLNAKNSIDTLLKTASDIGSVRVEIEKLAKQTHMLSLNASIEAARAGGTAGQAFAVVAREVQELSKATSEQTERIGARVEAIFDAAQTVTKNVDEIHEGISVVSDLANQNRAALDRQKETAESIAADAHSAAEGTTSVASEVDTITTAITHTNASAIDVDRASRQVRDDISAITKQLSDFLEAVKQLI
ncbi:methyl-accepting chemotaxis protein [Kordiimonas sp. SCSIO 12610]|uniref:methyl-accepting chemotaxis protein n=1 Tax=Kordiimonas sp. SCSIO 12610 TaxID=2829597 RepID=UPI0021094C03|nr:methyl-accepting chemotaxis protein [Kordiimonas sp. SCSIO 12610]UTW56376.1 GAF domain-containing protein [Kordiimonas sp. SCSIO 12610]